MDQKTLATWLKKALDALPKGSGKSQKGLAARLGVKESAVSNLKSGLRRFQAHEVPIIADYLGVDLPSAGIRIESVGPARNDGDTMTVVRPFEPASTRRIRGKGIIAPGVWREGGEVVSLQAAAVPPDPNPKLQGLDQYWVVHEDNPNKFAICVPYFDIRQKPLDGDEVHVTRQRGGMTEHTIRRVVLKGGRVELHDTAPGKRSSRKIVFFPSGDDLETVTIEGLVVADHTSRTI